MSTAKNGDVEIYFESFGDPDTPTLLLVNGLGSQCINYAVEWCQLFCEAGFHVVRFDNRDVGLSAKLEGVDYTLADIADDAAPGGARCAGCGQGGRVMGCSMGGMMVQRLAINHPERLLSMTSVMSRTGEPGYGESSEAALAFLTAPPAASATPTSTTTSPPCTSTGPSPNGSTTTPSGLGPPPLTTAVSVRRDRPADPRGHARGSRAEQLALLDLPTLVIHGSRDTLIDPSGGRQTAALIPGARYVEIEGMGARLPATGVGAVGGRLVRVRARQRRTAPLTGEYS